MSRLLSATEGRYRQPGDAWGRGYGYGLSAGIVIAYSLHWLVTHTGAWAGLDWLALLTAPIVFSLSVARSVVANRE